MNKTHVFNFLMGGFLLLLASGCASPIAENLRKEAAQGATFSMVFENPDTYQGSTVIWGGKIIRTVTTKDGSQIYILQSSLDSEDKPQSTDTSQGRFIAETDRKLDPMVYAKGRKITVAGKVVGKKVVTHKKLGGTYTYPVVQSEQLHLWAMPEPKAPAYWDPYWGSYWGGYDPYWDYPYFGGGWGGGDEDEGGGGDHDHD